MSQDAKLAKAKEKKQQAKTKRKGKKKAMSTSLLIENVAMWSVLWLEYHVD
jgi:hypothetical protein